MMMYITYVEMTKRAGDKSRLTLVRRTRGASPDWHSLGAVCGLSGGIMVALMGSVLTAIPWFAATGSATKSAGMILLFLTIPLLMLGAHCLDLMDRRKDEARKLRYGEKR